ncbi:AcrR family transcriptional regulator [Nocardioides cavernae]|uniref:AcrR family transcriptional regulator n=1 Tax=Nocardioides cavernae TaxID=1921566 RepID=A0A7Y9GZI3_9ACTN|nr:TetR/AcrR family transcriptional regulator [Nocardioides cavernae]NYE35177.1 AcrR family transcriptional regulator [Nocardioides cavernae]
MPTTTRDRVLDAAESLFFSRGIAVTGVDRVADAAGVAIATLYKQAGSKDGLLAAVLERRLADWTAHWDAALAAAATDEDRLLALFDALVSYRAQARPTQWCCFLATASERPRQPGADVVQDLLDRDTALLTRRLRELAEPLSDDPDELAAQLLVVYDGALASLLRQAPDDALVRARRVAAAVVGAVRRP